MPLQTAVALLALTVGTALLRTHRGGLRILADPGAAGVALRRLIPVCVAGPFLIGWLTFFGVTTEFFSAASGLTFSVSLMCVLLLLAVGWTTRELNRIDRERVVLLRSEREARDAAEEANRAKSEFLGVMSHELRTPLNSVISYADILDAGIKGPLNDDQLHYVKRIRISGAHLRSMIEELLQFTSAQKGAVTLEIRPVDAAELAREALAVVAHEVDTGTVEVHHQLPDEPLEIHTDPDKVLHVLVNLLANALKFTKRGRVGLRVLEESRSVVFEVWDTGPGIPKEHRERIFQEFTQLETDGDGRKGTGLGLAIGRAYADLLDARLEVDSWVGRGSVFRLVLPNDGARAS
jgi:signal transduction histidine kinase